MGTYRYQKSGHWLCRPTDEVLEPWPPRLDHAALPPSHPAIDIDRKDICVFSELHGEKNGFQATKKFFFAISGIKVLTNHAGSTPDHCG